MNRQRGADPRLLDPEATAYHQLATFSQDPLSLAESLERSPLCLSVGGVGFPALYGQPRVLATRAERRR